MEKVDLEPSSHLSVIVDLSPTQWHLSSLPKNEQQPLSFRSFISQTLAFLNSHLALKHENTLSVYGALPGKRFVFYSQSFYCRSPTTRLPSVLLYSSTIPGSETDDITADANTYQPFKVVDHAVTKRITEELELLKEVEEEGCVMSESYLTLSIEPHH